MNVQLKKQTRYISTHLNQKLNQSIVMTKNKNELLKLQFRKIIKTEYV